MAEPANDGPQQGAAGEEERIPTMQSEPPDLAAVAARLTRPTAVVGLFAAEGGHAADDVPTALSRARVPVAYVGAIGVDRRIVGPLVEMVDDGILRAAA